MGLGMLSIEDYVDAWQEVLTRSMGQVPSYLLYLPATLPVQDVPKVVRALLASSGVLYTEVS
jgi:hypothetical protein